MHLIMAPIEMIAWFDSGITEMWSKWSGFSEYQTKNLPGTRWKFTSAKVKLMSS
ncbi:hypothetical protein [Desulfosporosinus youngiae]|uniref:Uncharacterized protein n=1 Tax=Desulfosporosinus youngiae DSM 17734 TaxID=768710 RepID=H5Y527_9FIRM|nr:hypothetical protein [Desulfosporosinus youngiae]EHQ90131.1 hypothetical protein DesyoDRAFT_3094 [Desulfosporosinus youngiae DSM 17734]